MFLDQDLSFKYGRSDKLRAQMVFCIGKNEMKKKSKIWSDMKKKSSQKKKQTDWIFSGICYCYYHIVTTNKDKRKRISAVL